MENTKYEKRREGRWTPIRTKAQDTRANPNSWETHLERKRWDIELLRALSLRIMMINRVNKMLMNRFEIYQRHTKPRCMYMYLDQLIKNQVQMPGQNTGRFSRGYYMVWLCSSLA